MYGMGHTFSLVHFFPKSLWLQQNSNITNTDYAYNKILFMSRQISYIILSKIAEYNEHGYNEFTTLMK